MVRDIDLEEPAMQTPVELLEDFSAWHKNAWDVFTEGEPSKRIRKYLSKVSGSSYFRSPEEPPMAQLKESIYGEIYIT